MGERRARFVWSSCVMSLMGVKGHKQAPGKKIGTSVLLISARTINSGESFGAPLAAAASAFDYC